MIKWDTYRDKLVKAEDTVNGYFPQKKAILDDERYSDTYKQGQIETLNTQTEQAIDRIFKEIRDGFNSEMADALKKAEGTEQVDWNERSYYAVAVAQELEGQKPASILAMYDSVIEEGKKARIAEFERLAMKALAGTGEEWTLQKKMRANFTPQQEKAVWMKAAEEPFMAGIQVFENDAKYTYNGSRDGMFARGTQVLSTGFNRFRQNVEQQAANPGMQ